MMGRRDISYHPVAPLVASVLLILFASTVYAACINGKPDSTDSTKCESCNDDWSGVSCDIACGCVKGYCTGGISGDGNCTSCWSPLYGPECNLDCSCQFGTCNSQTDLATGGQCASCNSVDIQGVNCDSCLSGRAGALCEIVCPDCGAQGTCDEGIKNSGKCICDEGWYGGACNRNLLTKTKSLSETEHFTPIPPTPVPTTIAPPTPVPTITTPAPYVAPATTLGPEVELIELWFSTSPLLSEVKATLAAELYTAEDLITVTLVSGSSNKFAVQLPSQALYYQLIASLNSGTSSAFGTMGLSQYSEQLVASPTIPTPPTPTPTDAPQLRLEEEESEGIAPFAIAIISIAVLALMVAIILVGLFIWVRKERKKLVVEKEKLTTRRVQYSNGDTTAAANTASSEDGDTPMTEQQPQQPTKAVPAGLDTEEVDEFNQLPADRHLSTTPAVEGYAFPTQAASVTEDVGVLKRKPPGNRSPGAASGSSSLAAQRQKQHGADSKPSPLLLAEGGGLAPPPRKAQGRNHNPRTNESATAAMQLGDDIMPGDNHATVDVDPVEAQFDDNYSPPEAAIEADVLPPTQNPDADLEFQLDDLPDDDE